MSKEIEAVRKLFKKSKRLQKLMKRVQNQKIMTDNPTPVSGLNLKDLERKLDKALDKETAESLKEWLRSKRQNPVTDEQIKEKAYQISIDVLKSPAYLDHSTMMLRLIEIATWLRDLQPKTDDSVTDNLLQELYDRCDQDIIVKSDFYLRGFEDGVGYQSKTDDCEHKWMGHFVDKKPKSRFCPLCEETEYFEIDSFGKKWIIKNDDWVSYKKQQKAGSEWTQETTYFMIAKQKP